MVYSTFPKDAAMTILAMAPSVPLGGKLFIALLMLVLAGLLVRTIRGAPFTVRSAVVAVVVSVTVVIALETIFPRVYGGGFHSRGLIAAMVGGLSGAILLQPDRRKPNRRRYSNTVGLSAVAFISGPLIGLILAALTIYLFNVSPLDRGYTFGVFTVIGTMAGLIGVIVVAVASASAVSQSSGSNEN